MSRDSRRPRIEQPGPTAAPETLGDVSNHPLSELVDRIAAERRVWVRAAVAKQGESWTLVVLEITLGTPPPRWERARWRYPEAAFLAASPKGSTAARWLERGRLALQPPTVGFSPGDWVSRDWHESGWPSVYQQLEWPSLVWSIRPPGSAALPLLGELVAPDAPAFLSFQEAALAFFSAPRLPNSRFNSTEIVIREQLIAARIESVTITPSELVVNVGGSALGGTRLTVGGTLGSSKRLSATATQARLPLGSPPGPGAWLALHRDEQLLDRRVLDPEWRQGDVQVEVDLATQTQILISRGEGPDVEFKRQLPGGDPQGPMKSISAFANGNGGAIIFGVDDDGQVVGIDDQDAAQAVDRLATLISDWTHPPVDCAPQLVKLGSANVVVVSVPPGVEPPYGVGTSDRKLVYYVRRGATSAPARPSDVRAAVRASIPIVPQEL